MRKLSTVGPGWFWIGSLVCSRVAETESIVIPVACVSLEGMACVPIPTVLTGYTVPTIICINMYSIKMSNPTIDRRVQTTAANTREPTKIEDINAWKLERDNPPPVLLALNKVVLEA